MQDFSQSREENPDRMAILIPGWNLRQLAVSGRPPYLVCPDRPSQPNPANSRKGRHPARYAGAWRAAARRIPRHGCEEGFAVSEGRLGRLRTFIHCRRLDARATRAPVFENRQYQGWAKIRMPSRNYQRVLMDGFAGTDSRATQLQVAFEQRVPDDHVPETSFATIISRRGAGPIACVG